MNISNLSKGLNGLIGSIFFVGLGIFLLLQGDLLSTLTGCCSILFFGGLLLWIIYKKYTSNNEQNK